MNSRFLAHFPQPVCIPENTEIKRDVVVNEMKVSRSAAIQPLDEEACSQYDSRTLFYDMFFKSGDLICLGPPFLNLGTPTAVHCDGKPVRFTCNKLPLPKRKLSALRLRLPLGKDRERLDLKFSFPDFETTASLDALQARPPALSFRDLCLHTLQKDSPGEWIRDWCLWHHRAHGVQRVIIYDNGSCDFPELDGAFTGLNADLEIILVHWPFPHGPTVSYQNKFCQTGALNHFRLFFGAAVRWGINLDIDEYLYVNARQSLREFLGRPDRVRSPAIYFGSLKFPRPDVRMGVLPRFFHHRMCISECAEFWAAPKYVFQPGRVSYCFVHSVIPRLAENQALQYLQRIYRRLRGVLQHRLRYFFKRTPARAAKDDILFHHYFGLYNDWRGRGRRKHSVSDFPQGALAENRDVSELAARLGLTEEASSIKKEESEERRVFASVHADECIRFPPQGNK